MSPENYYEALFKEVPGGSVVKNLPILNQLPI